MNSPLSKTGDYLIARGEAEKKVVEELLLSARNENDYFREKLAAKLFAYHEKECALMQHYIEIKLYYPLLAEALEKNKPFLKELWNIAEKELTDVRPKGAEISVPAP